MTVTPSRAALFDAKLIRPGTHVAAMGSDSKGKQEIPVELLRAASLFADFPQQSRVIGEFQHVAAELDAGSKTVTAIGDVLRGAAKGRQSRDEITVFDSSGVSIQDLLVASRIVELARARSFDLTARYFSGRVASQRPRVSSGSTNTSRKKYEL